MKTVCEKDKCTGCMACVDVCPKGAIHIEDSLAAYNAVIDENLCVNCDACHRVCQNDNEVQYQKPILWKQGWRADPELRAASSSGGAAASLMATFVEKYGSVCSCVFRNGGFRFEFAENLHDIVKFTGSKYVKSNPEGIYRPIKKKLAAGEKVLFIGLPCQVAAVQLFVGEKLCENLYTVDLICHGSPSPQFLQEFLTEHKLPIQTVKSIAFRKKAKFHLYRECDGVEPDRVADAYTHAFLNCLDYTENCYSCKYAHQKRISDLTIGDSWGSDLPQDEQDQGISLVLCQTEKGKELLLSSDMKLLDVDVDKAIANNTQLRHPSEKPAQREKFLEEYRKSGNFSRTVAKCYPKIFVKQKIKKLLIATKIWGGVTNNHICYKLYIRQSDVE